LKALFNEELGVVLQVRTEDRDAVMQTLREHGLCPNTATSIGNPSCRQRHHGGQVGEVRGLARHQDRLQRASLSELNQVWDERELEASAQQRDNPVGADASTRQLAPEASDPGLHVLPEPTLQHDVERALRMKLSRPRMAVLREQGVNSACGNGLRLQWAASTPSTCT
jgi:phosphoribosylformylglycinamidine synthase